MEAHFCSSSNKMCMSLLLIHAWGVESLTRWSQHNRPTNSLGVMWWGGRQGVTGFKQRCQCYMSSLPRVCSPCRCVFVQLYTKRQKCQFIPNDSFYCEMKMTCLMCVCVRVQADEAFVTLATNDNYAKGAMVLGQSLRKHNTTRKLVALVGPHVAEPCR